MQVDFSGILSGIVGVECVHDDHWTTTSARYHMMAITYLIWKHFNNDCLEPKTQSDPLAWELLKYLAIYNKKIRPIA